MVMQHGFEKATLEALFAQGKYRGDIIRVMDRPPEIKPWHAYRKTVIADKVIADGRSFLHKHATLLARAEREYGTPPEIITAIIGVETRYGASLGKHRVFDALTTLAFGYARRASFYAGELEQFLLLARAEDLDALAPTGSYAGAMGLAQFLPSSYRRYAVDFDGDGRRDLWSYEDAIGSVANYLNAYGWQPGTAVTVPAVADSTLHAGLVDENHEPVRSVSELTEQGVQPSAPLDGSARATFMQFEGEDGVEYWIGLHTFYVITRYNNSTRYALAVYQLSELIAKDQE
jgi:membrane-bound lytic murein transglycosylase B